MLEHERESEAREAALRAIEIARKRLAVAVRRDALLVSVENVITDLDKVINLLCGRLREWYALHFPELEVESSEKYAQLVLALNKENLEESEKSAIRIVGREGKQIIEKLKRSTGLALNEKDISAVRSTARQVIQLIKFRQELEAYATDLAHEVCPNLAEVGGPRIAAKLIARAGGLQKLARMPASTIQILGAEKALFKHLRKKTKPPKHGLIFQHTAVHSAPKKLRGKIARALSTQLSLAARIDAYGRRFVGKELRERFEGKLKEILRK